MLLSKAISIIEEATVGLAFLIKAPVHTSGGEGTKYERVTIGEYKIPASYLGLTSDMTPTRCVIVSYFDGKGRAIGTAGELCSILGNMLAKEDRLIYTMINGALIPFRVHLRCDIDNGIQPDLLIASYTH
jgi:hypothetical protein